MPILLFMMMSLMLAGAVISGRPTREQEVRADTESTAGAMVFYHAQAMRACAPPVGCTPGVLTVTAPAGSSMNIAVMGRNFISSNDGNVLITTVTPTYAAGSAHLVGVLVRAIKERTQEAVTSGPYDPVTQSVSTPPTVFRQSGAAEYYAAQQTLTDVNSIQQPGLTTTAPRSSGTLYVASAISALVVPENVGGVPLVIHHPVMATRLNWTGTAAVAPVPPAPIVLAVASIPPVAMATTPVVAIATPAFAPPVVVAPTFNPLPPILPPPPPAASAPVTLSPTGVPIVAVPTGRTFPSNSLRPKVILAYYVDGVPMPSLGNGNQYNGNRILNEDYSLGGLSAIGSGIPTAGAGMIGDSSIYINTPSSSPRNIEIRVTVYNMQMDTAGSNIANTAYSHVVNSLSMPPYPGATFDHFIDPNNTPFATTVLVGSSAHSGGLPVGSGNATSSATHAYNNFFSMTIIQRVTIPAGVTSGVIQISSGFAVFP